MSELKFEIAVRQVKEICMFLPKRQNVQRKVKKNRQRWKPTKTTKNRVHLEQLKMERGSAVASDKAGEISRGQIMKNLVELWSLC